MGLAASTSRVPTTEPTIFIFCALPTLTPTASPIESANCEVSVAVTRTPPFSTNDWRCSTPSQPSPGRMSSVESFSPTRFGVSAVVFQGSGFPQALGSPLMIDVVLEKPTGGNKITSYFEFKSVVLVTICVLIKSYGMPRLSSAMRHQPAPCVLSHV